MKYRWSMVLVVLLVLGAAAYAAVAKSTQASIPPAQQIDTASVGECAAAKISSVSEEGTPDGRAVSCHWRVPCLIGYNCCEDDPPSFPLCGKNNNGRCDLEGCEGVCCKPGYCY